MDYSTQTAPSWPADAPALEALSYDHALQPPQQQQQPHERQQYYQQQHQQHQQHAPFKLEQQAYGDSLGSAFDSDFLILDQYLVPEQLEDAGMGALNNYAPLSATLSYGTPSPALPALSPPSTAGTSYESSPTGSAYGGLISPHVLPPPHTNAPAQQPSFLLPAADIFNTSEPAPMHRDAHLNKGSSCFAQMQDSYLQQHAQAYSPAHPPSTPLRTRTISEGVPSSTTPRGQGQNAHVYRSPGPAYSPSSSPTKSPYARNHTPIPFAASSPSRPATYLQRSHSQRSPSKADGASENAERRRQSRLSIAVPPYQPRSARSRPPPSRELPPNAASGFQIVGDVELEATQEMEQLLGQLGSFLGPDASANESPQPQHRAPPDVSRGRTVGGSYNQQLDASQGSALAPPPTSFGGSIDISGVRLSEEDMALLDEPDYYNSDQRQYPASAPAWQTSFNFGPSGPHPPFQQRSSIPRYTAAPLSPHYPTSQYTSASLAPPLLYSHADFDGPLSAPLRPRSTPILEQQATFAAPPPLSGGGVRRRRSSVDDAASYALASPIYAINSSYTYDQQPNLQQLYSYSRPAPTQRHAYSPSPSASSISSASSPVAVHRLPAQAITPRTSPTKLASPRKTRASPTKKKGAGGLPMFVNFGASDSKKLLSGVAPSGSSKRRREEQEAAAQAAAASSSS